jgi:hypothetical protein
MRARMLQPERRAILQVFGWEDFENPANSPVTFICPKIEEIFGCQTLQKR